MKLFFLLFCAWCVTNAANVWADDEHDEYEENAEAPMARAWENPLQAFTLVCSHLLKVSGIQEPVGCKYTEKHRDIEGSPVAAVSPDYPANPAGKWVVLAGYGLFEAVRDEDELAAILGHEIAHIAYGHSDKRAKVFVDKCMAWYEAKRKKNPNWSPGDDQLIEQCRNQKVVAEAVNKIAREQENEADAGGMNLMIAAGYDSEAAPKAMRHMGDWAWATLGNEELSRQMTMKLLDAQKISHESPAAREKKLKKLQEGFFPSR